MSKIRFDFQFNPQINLRSYAVVLLVVALLCRTTSLHAQTFDTPAQADATSTTDVKPDTRNSIANGVDITALLVSDLFYHGTTETVGEPALAINAEWQINSRYFVGLQVQQGIEDGPRQRQRSIMAYVGAGFSLSDNWFATASVQHREFPGSLAEWDFTEFELDFAHRSGFGFKIDYSPDYYERDSAAYSAEARFVGALNRQAYWYLEAGALEIDESEFLDHQYARAGVGGSLGPVQLDVSYRVNSQGSSEFFGSEAFSPSKVVVELAYRLR